MPPSRLALQPLTAEIALRAYQWPADFHGDPADRLIAATADIGRLILVTSDEKLLERTDLQTLSTR
jgi:PIN domain nuclease of toxin-antitoxin system